MRKTASFRPGLETLEARLAPATFIWDGSDNVNWHDPNNWSVNLVTPVNPPMSGDKVVITSVGNHPQISQAGVTIRELTMLDADCDSTTTLTLLNKPLTVDDSEATADVRGRSLLEDGEVILSSDLATLTFKNQPTARRVLLGNEVSVTTVVGQNGGNPITLVDSQGENGGTRFVLVNGPQLNLTGASRFIIRDAAQSIHIENAATRITAFAGSTLEFEANSNLARANLYADVASANSQIRAEDGTIIFNGVMNATANLIGVFMRVDAGFVDFKEGALVEFTTAVNPAVEANVDSVVTMRDGAGLEISGGTSHVFKLYGTLNVTHAYDSQGSEVKAVLECRDGSTVSFNGSGVNSTLFTSTLTAYDTTWNMRVDGTAGDSDRMYCYNDVSIFGITTMNLVEVTPAVPAQTFELVQYLGGWFGFEGEYAISVVASFGWSYGEHSELGVPYYWGIVI